MNDATATKSKRVLSIEATGLVLNTEVIRQGRHIAGLTQSEVGVLLGVDRSYVARLETGDRQPSHAVLVGLSKLYGLTPHAITHRKADAEILAAIAG